MRGLQEADAIIAIVDDDPSVRHRRREHDPKRAAFASITVIRSDEKRPDRIEDAGAHR